MNMTSSQRAIRTLRIDVPVGTMKLWRHEQSGKLCWSSTAHSLPHFMQLTPVAEDDLPADLPEDLYAWWLHHSMLIEGVRYGPPVT